MPDQIYNVTWNGEEKVKYTYDGLGRLTNKQIASFENAYTYENVGENETSTLVKTVTTPSGTLTYEYDKLGNIISITDGTYTTTYEYDSLNQLTRVNDEKTGKTTTYAYTNGNITEQNEYAYTTAELGETTNTKNWNYNDSVWSDLLTDYNGTQITYDEIGNPLTIGSKNLSWLGRQLQSITDGENEIAYSYNGDGNRVSKTVNGTTTEYYYNGSILAGQKTGDDTLVFMYDNNSDIFGFIYNDTEYYYIKNAQNDVIAIADKDGKVIANYHYDAWGKVISITDSRGNIVPSDDSVGRGALTPPSSASENDAVTNNENANNDFDASVGVGVPDDPSAETTTTADESNEAPEEKPVDFEFGEIPNSGIIGGSTAPGINADKLANQKAQIALINPILYRSYYYDRETEWYYLNTRYYSPEMCRFINADGIVQTGQGMLDKNMFAYCMNNPITRIDSNGRFSIAVAIALGVIAVCMVVGAIWAGTSKTNLYKKASSNSQSNKTSSYNKNKTSNSNNKKSPASSKKTNKNSKNKNSSISTSENEEKLKPKEIAMNVFIGATMGMAVGGALVALGGVACAVYLGSAAVCGTISLAALATSRQVAAIGILAFNAEAMIFGPLYFVELEPIEWSE